MSSGQLIELTSPIGQTAAATHYAAVFDEIVRLALVAEKSTSGPRT